MKERKHEAPPRYDAAFKEGAIRLVTEEGRPMREVAEELGVCTDTIRNWLKASGIQPKETERQNRMRAPPAGSGGGKQSAAQAAGAERRGHRDLKKSVGILSRP
ncbi:MAG: transposase [Coprococcus sp.]